MGDGSWKIREKLGETLKTEAASLSSLKSVLIYRGRRKLAAAQGSGEYNRGQSTNLDRPKIGGWEKKGAVSLFALFGGLS
jgi:hypothetical protein